MKPNGLLWTTRGRHRSGPLPEGSIDAAHFTTVGGSWAKKKNQGVGGPADHDQVSGLVVFPSILFSPVIKTGRDRWTPKMSLPCMGRKNGKTSRLYRSDRNALL